MLAISERANRYTSSSIFPLIFHATCKCTHDKSHTSIYNMTDINNGINCPILYFRKVYLLQLKSSASIVSSPSRNNSCNKNLYSQKQLKKSRLFSYFQSTISLDLIFWSPKTRTEHS